MLQFSVGGRDYAVEKFRLGEIKALASIMEQTIEPTAVAALDRSARVVEAATRRFGDQAFVASDDAECAVGELTAACAAILAHAGFRLGEAAAAAG